MKTIFIRSNPVSPYPRLEKTVNSVVRNGHEAHVLAWDRSENYKLENSILKLPDCSVPITRFGITGEFGGGFKKNTVSLIKFQFKIFEWLFKNRKNYEAIHAYDLDTGFTSMVFSKIFRKKIIYDIADYYVDSHNFKGSTIEPLVKKIEQLVINNSNAVIICTEKRKKQIEGSNPKKLTIIHNAPNEKLSNIREKVQKSKDDSGKLKIVYVGILDEGRFIKEIADAISKRNDCEFHIGGFGVLEEYFRKIEQENSNIFFYGKIPYNKTLALESECDVITAIYDPQVANHYYAAPNKFYEALMLGKPLIMAKNTGMADVVEKENIGEVIQYSEEGFNEAITKIKNQKHLWKEISSNSKGLYKTYYSWDIMEQRLVSLYKNL